MKKVILNLGAGTLLKGYETVIGEILSRERAYPLRFTGKLPAAPLLDQTQQQWHQLYAARNQNLALRIELLSEEGLSFSESAFQKVCADLIQQLNDWLNTPDFLSVDRILRTELKRDDDVQIILESNDLQLKKMPWHLWHFLEDYPCAELTFSNCDWRPFLPVSPANRTSSSRILATFGNSDGLDPTAELTTLNKLSNTDLSVLTAPSLNQLHEELWQPQGWDIFFFAGHSQTFDDIGVIDLNNKERLTIEQIRHALSKAISNGLKIAIFNSCDGLGLAQQLSDLQIPYIVVMREPISDAVAQQFLDHLLTAFSEGLPFHLSVREARQRLAGLDNDIPCASWLPIIWQNPTAPAIYWSDLGCDLPGPSPPANHHPWRSIACKSAVVSSIVIGLRTLALLTPLEFAAYDQLMRQRLAESVDSRIVMVEISQETTSEYGYPLPDETLTTLIEKVTEAQPLVIGLDLHRSKPNPAGNILESDTATESVIAISDTAKTMLLPKTMGEPTTEIANSSISTTVLSEQPTSHAGYNKFLQQVEDTPYLFLVCVYGSIDKNYRIPPQLSEDIQYNQVGFSDLPTDGKSPWSNIVRNDLPGPENTALMGAMVRRQLLSYDPGLMPAPSTCTTPYSLSFQLAFQYLDEKGITPMTVTPNEEWQFGPVIMKSLPQRFGGYQQLEGPTSQLLINYRANQPGQKITLQQLISDNFDAQMLQDRVVLIGYTAPVSKDYFETPYGPMAGIWVHGHMTSQLLSAVLDGRPLIHTLPQWHNWQWGDMLWIVAWGGWGGYLGWRTKGRLSIEKASQMRWLLAITLSGLALYGVCWLGLIAGLWLPLVPSALALGGSSVWLRLTSSQRGSSQNT